ncbi:potassium channel family protein [Halobellus clavatus]|uniref:Trk K+ transport system, NAD-binding component n=1 Tax=Halobellus clavatus TaxID=660517 RepID=A0A1H3H6Z8_9EURY|nr:NAD-binding protein [Halobellus clavatus]SDY11292.1 Trk K+ transport system, NAD-binding component [Halobellus clavatus]
MNTWGRRVIGYTVFLVAVMLLTALTYQWGMRTYEADPVTFLHSLQVVVEMFTTTGFGGDSPWTSPQMNVFITVMDLVGMALLIGTLPVLATPFLERAFSTTVPKALEDALEDHIVICSYTPRVEALTTELDSQGVPYVIVESDRAQATELYEDGRRVILADPESTEGLTRAGLPEAQALVADGDDQVDASIVLAAKEVAEDVEVLSVVEEPERAKYHRLAGADQVLSPRSLLGESLAAKVTTALTAEIDEAIEISDDLELAEVPVHHGSPLVGTTLADSGIREETGVNVIGAWFHGEFTARLSPDDELTAGTVLFVSGRSEQLAELLTMTRAGLRQFGTGQTLIVGHGQVGRTIAGVLDEAGAPYTTIDDSEQSGVDIVGDATDPETLKRAGINDARTVVLALPDDTTTEFATLVIRDLAPEIEIIARVEEAPSIPKTFRAGGDYVLSLATVTGRMIASRVLRDRDVLSLDQQIEVIRMEAPRAVGQTVGNADIRARTGSTIVAIERDAGIVTDVGPDTRIQADDRLIVAGTDQSVREFERVFA